MRWRRGTSTRTWSTRPTWCCLGADEFINGLSRWCLWLKDCPPATLRAMPSVLHRVAAVRSYRQASKRETTRRLAETPTLFGEDRQPGGRYVLVPRHSSERRAYVPMGFVEAGTVCGDANMLVAGAGRSEEHTSELQSP